MVYQRKYNSPKRPSFTRKDLYENPRIKYGHYQSQLIIREKKGKDITSKL